jgi:alpha-L-fucosidase
MKKLFLLALLLSSLQLFAQDYQPNWESLDKRPTPQWFKDAKFGIFIHWGVYSVPAYCTKGNYAEWYQYGLQTGDTSRISYHKAKFGNLSYYQLAGQFKAELFNPDEWARLFEQSGAKYIVLTSKHHDGYCLWPSREADRNWGFPWNATEVGPKRDLIGDLFKAVRKTTVHAGMYYSLYEWFNPLWKADHKKFAAEHTWPQMKDLINNYRPEVFWTDGDWDAPPETWKSQEFLAWLYNESPVKEKIVVNDRWGSGVRFHHAGIYTPEYQPGLDFANHYWEESRGMGFSYGYNREEDAWDYNSTQSLVLQLVDKVSRGGNFLLDIGPDEHGKIPPIMQERLLQIGDWMKINGEAIYNTVKWKMASQWSEGRTDYQPKTGSGDLLLKLTIDPDPGYAVKEVFYTYNNSSNTLYAILPKYPGNRRVVLKDIVLPAGTVVDFLSTKEKLPWKTENGNTAIDMLEYNPNSIKAPYAYVIRISNFGSFAPTPVISADYSSKGLTPTVSLSVPGTATLRYTTDGSEPTGNAALYTNPFTLAKTAVIKAKAFLPGTLPGATAEQRVVKYEWLKSVKAGHLTPGIGYRYYEPDEAISLQSAGSGQPVKTGVTNRFSLAEKQRKDRFAFSFEGYIRIAKDALCTFFTASDDGSKLFIDDNEVVNNDGEHGAVEATGKALLKKGIHKIKVLYFDGGGDNSLKVSMQAGNGPKEEIPAGLLFH